MRRRMLRLRVAVKREERGPGLVGGFSVGCLGGCGMGLGSEEDEEKDEEDQDLMGVEDGGDGRVRNVCWADMVAELGGGSGFGVGVEVEFGGGSRSLSLLLVWPSVDGFKGFA